MESGEHGSNYRKIKDEYFERLQNEIKEQISSNMERLLKKMKALNGIKADCEVVRKMSKEMIVENERCQNEMKKLMTMFERLLKFIGTKYSGPHEVQQSNVKGYSRKFESNDESSSSNETYDVGMVHKKMKLTVNVNDARGGLNASDRSCPTMNIEPEKCYICPRVIALMGELNTKKNMVKISDFKRLDEEYKRSNGSNVLPCFNHVAKELENDIAAHAPVSDDIIALPRALFYAAFDEMHTMEPQDIDEGAMLRWGFVIKDALRLGLNVEFAKEQLVKIAHVYFYKLLANGKVQTLKSKILQKKPAIDEKEKLYCEKKKDNETSRVDPDIEDIKNSNEKFGNEAFMKAEHVKCYGCQRVETFKGKLDAKKSKEKISDDRHINDEYKTSNRSSEPLYFEIVFRGLHGDIAAHGTFSNDKLFAAMEEMLTMKLEDIDEAVMLRWGLVFKNARRFGLDVEFAEEYLVKSAHVFFSKSLANDKKELQKCRSADLEEACKNDEQLR